MTTKTHTNTSTAQGVAKFTPGPWAAVPVESGAKWRHFVYVKIQAERSIAYATPTHAAPDQGEVGGTYAELPAGRARGVTISAAEALANARPIAQAPAMLEALYITSNCSPVTRDLDAMPDDAEITLTFCVADLRQIRATILAAIEGQS